MKNKMGGVARLTSGKAREVDAQATDIDLTSPGKDDRARNQMEAVATEKESPSIS